MTTYCITTVHSWEIFLPSWNKRKSLSRTSLWPVIVSLSYNLIVNRSTFGIHIPHEGATVYSFEMKYLSGLYTFYCKKLRRKVILYIIEYIVTYTFQTILWMGSSEKSNRNESFITASNSLVRIKLSNWYILFRGRKSWFSILECSALKCEAMNLSEKKLGTRYL